MLVFNRKALVYYASGLFLNYFFIPKVKVFLNIQHSLYFLDDLGWYAAYDGVRLHIFGAATTAPSPMVTPARTVALAPIHTFLPMWIGA